MQAFSKIENRMLEFTHVAKVRDIPNTGVNEINEKKDIKVWVDSFDDIMGKV